MQILLYNCASNTMDLIKKAYGNEKNEIIELRSLNDVQEGLINEKEYNILILETQNLDLKNLSQFRSKRHNVFILALFDKLSLDLMPHLINRKVVDFIECLPLVSVGFIEELIEQVRFLPKDEIKANVEKDLIILSESKKYEKYKDMLVMQYIYDLIYGNVANKEAIDDITSILNLTRIPNVVITIMVDDFWDICFNLDNKQRYNLKSSILKVVKEAIKTYNGIASSLIGTDKIVILLDLPYKNKNEEDYLLTVANDIKSFIKMNFIYTITLGLSNIYKDYRDLWRGYEESFQAVNYSFHRGNDVIIEYKDIEDINNNKVIDYNFTNYKYHIFKNFTRGDTKTILSFYDNLFDSFVLGKYERDSIRNIINRFIFDILEYCVDIGLDKNEISKLSIETSNQILRASSITSIKEISRRFIENISERILDATKNSLEILLEASVIFINNYYYEQITLEDVSHVANMSEYYFSRKFKQQYGINFINYLLNVRLEASYKLLMSTNLTITDIAEKVGFNDLAYFSRKFKEKYTYSPSYIRNNQVGENV